MSAKFCSKCKSAFECLNQTAGCWCEDLHIDLETLKKLKEEFQNCLCPDCLKGFARLEKDS